MTTSHHILEQALKLPLCSEMIIPEDYLDGNGHMNMMYYTLVGNIGSRQFWDDLGLRHQLKRSEGKRSTFMLKQVLNYVHELREGEEVAIYAGLADYTPKLLHYFVYIVSKTDNRLACWDERLEISIDMAIRRSAPFDPEVLEQIERVRQKHQSTGWTPDFSGAIKLKK
jgi:acyl-CoA thioester hydrolase